MSAGDSGTLDEGSLAEATKAAEDGNLRAGDLEPIRICLLCEVDANCTARESLTDCGGHSDELTAKTRELQMTLGRKGKRAWPSSGTGLPSKGQSTAFLSFMLIVRARMCVCVCVWEKREEEGE